MWCAEHLCNNNIHVQHSKCFTFTVRQHRPHYPKCRRVTFPVTQMCMHLQNRQHPLQALAVMRPSVKGRPPTLPSCPACVWLHVHRIKQSSISLDSTGAVFFSLCGGVLSWQQPVRAVMRVLHLCSTLGAAAAERGAEARADRLSKQYEHDAVGCSLRGVANSLLGPNKSL